MQRGAGGSQCLRTDDCSVTLINREEQVALRQAAGRPLLLPPPPGTGGRAFASPDVPSTPVPGPPAEHPLPSPSPLRPGQAGWGAAEAAGRPGGCTAQEMLVASPSARPLARVAAVPELERIMLCRTWCSVSAPSAAAGLRRRRGAVAP